MREYNSKKKLYHIFGDGEENEKNPATRTKSMMCFFFESLIIDSIIEKSLLFAFLR